MKKTERQRNYGSCLGIWVNYTIQTLPKNKRKEYKLRFINELKNYSFKTRQQGEPRNEGCVLELEDIVDTFDVKNPEHLARAIKETLHLFYNKSTAKTIMNSLLEML